ncbi:BspA family leucine-rich repeat surface protein [Chryseobacterium sp. 09-1422]|uniref:BspA family leucine-rich repeat surface protein n=1 Tax=Chryseobacterium kimseyorum TaxID=2984028 RepID=A0ABT3I2P9_9FLAO|nr:BspA family leucine-rich repeat surface protein [Chryseobacterium kimseyorum]MCW3170123.1 BspA family leucine-rich repeat surface protein [Chryseobacterium kimseyorum]
MKKLIFFIMVMLSSQLTKAQNEFITIWKPSGINPNFITTVAGLNPSTSSQIWFPGTGLNYTIQWEEVNYPQHNAILPNVTSIGQVLINFGTPLNPNPAQATYRVKVSNGNGVFTQIKFATMTTSVNGAVSWSFLGNSDKLLEISQWGNIQWQSMYNAFSHCRYVQITATDSPDLLAVLDGSYMFYNANSLTGNPSMANWNTSTIEDFQNMFSHQPAFQIPDTFNAPISSWNTSKATNFKSMFENRIVFNQNLNSWNTSSATNMGFMFAGTLAFNQPLNNWNTSNVTNMMWMFHFNTNFNQPLNSWNVSKVTDISHMFHGCTAFNQPLDSWNTNVLSDFNTVFSGATNFNQSLQAWSLPSLTIGSQALLGSGLNCDNYSDTLVGWANNPITANNINIGFVPNFTYAVDVVPHRNILLSKGWSMTGDTVGECRKLSTYESQLKNKGSIYPNPAENFIYLKNIKDAKSYIISDVSGRMITENTLSKDLINIQHLTPGNYILQIITRNDIQTYKFIKK